MNLMFEHNDPFSFLPSLPVEVEKPILDEKKHPDNLHHTIFYIETLKEILLYTQPHLPFKPFLTSSNRHENIFKNYCYFLLFTKLRGEHHRYGIYFHSTNLNLLELKVTLYSFPHHPIRLKVFHSDEKIIHQYCFGHSHFNFFLSWNRCKNELLTIHLEFIRNYTYKFQLCFEDLLSV